MRIFSNPSPNFDNRPKSADINLLIFHYTGMQSASDARRRLCDSSASVSAHYLIDEDGIIEQLVDEEKRAWHAGISCWQGISVLNNHSIGVELVNPGHEWGYRPFTAQQMDALLWLSKEIIKRHCILKRHILGHSDIAPNRKEDPGELFNWEWLAGHGVGLWPTPKKTFFSVKLVPEMESDAVKELQMQLSEYGYHIRKDGYYGLKTAQVVIAFRRHFLQDHIVDYWDQTAQQRLSGLLALL